VEPNTGTLIGSIQFTNTAYINSLPTVATATTPLTSPLTINGKPYILITSIGDSTNPHDLTKINGSGGNFALAGSLDAGGRLDSSGNVSGTVYTAAPITTFSGNIEGLGNTISNLVIIPTTIKNGTANLGLIGTIGGTATVRDIGIVNVYINDFLPNSTGIGGVGGSDIGALAGTNNGIIINAFATGNPNAGVPPGSAFNGTTYAGASLPTVTAAVSGGASVGGLVGLDHGIIVNSHAAVSVWGVSAVGGLVGSAAAFPGVGTAPNSFVAPIMLDDYSTGTVSGGLKSTGTTYLTLGGGGVGGFIGTNNGGVISNSYTTSAVYTENVLDVGGFAGLNTSQLVIPTTKPAHIGTLNNDSSSGQVNFYFTTITNDFNLGGLVGVNQGQISGGFTSSNLVVTTPPVTNGISQGGNVGALVGYQFRSSSSFAYGATNNSTATGTITCNSCNSSNFTGTIGTDFGTTTGVTWNPGGPTTPPPGQGPQLPPPPNPGLSRSQAQALANQAAALTAAAAQARAGGNAANGSMTAVNAAVSSSPGGAMSSAGTSAAAVPSSLALNANLRAIELGVQADDRRIHRRVTTAATAAPRKPLGATIRDIQINGRPVNPQQNNAPGGAPNPNPR
jgi:hypothetical protein